MEYFGFRTDSLLILATANAPLFDTMATGDSAPFGTGSLNSGMNIVSYRPGLDRIPRQFPPLMTGPCQALVLAASSAARIRDVSASVPCFSSRPPGMTIRLSAFCSSTTSATAPGACAAAIARMNTSTRSGIDAMSGTHRQPSIDSLPGLTT